MSQNGLTKLELYTIMLMLIPQGIYDSPFTVQQAQIQGLSTIGGGGMTKKEILKGIRKNLKDSGYKILTKEQKKVIKTNIDKSFSAMNEFIDNNPIEND